MSDLISRQDAVDVAKQHWYKPDIAKALEELPSVQPEPYTIFEDAPTIEPERKKGEWIDEGFYADGHGAHAFRCSECGGHIIEYDTDPFCKWCGADMRGEQDETN